MTPFLARTDLTQLQHMQIIKNCLHSLKNKTSNIHMKYTMIVHI